MKGLKPDLGRCFHLVDQMGWCYIVLRRLLLVVTDISTTCVEEL